VTPWDIRAFLRALGAALLGLVVVWLVTSASDEGQLTVGARAGRTLPLAPLCSAVGVALALGTARVRQEALAFETLGRSAAETGRAAAIGAALPSVVIGLAIGITAIDVSAFYPRVVRGEVFVSTSEGFVSPTLGVRIDPTGQPHTLADARPVTEEELGLPHHARLAAATATALAGVSLPLVAARATLRRSLLDRRRRRRMRLAAFVETFSCALFTLVAFQAAAARLTPALLAIVPSVLLLAVTIARLRFARRALGTT
jgi:hypothetical protein